MSVCIYTILGSLWVPPAPGRSPGMTSAVPTIVFQAFGGDSALAGYRRLLRSHKMNHIFSQSPCKHFSHLSHPWEPLMTTIMGTGEISIFCPHWERCLEGLLISSDIQLKDFLISSNSSSIPLGWFICYDISLSFSFKSLFHLISQKERVFLSSFILDPPLETAQVPKTRIFSLYYYYMCIIYTYI